MRLSEAILLSNMSGEQPCNLSWDTCLVGLAGHAVGISYVGLEQAEARWPWLKSMISHPCFYGGAPWPARFHLSYLCRKIANGKMTVSEAAAIIREMEPAEPETSTVTEGSGIAALEEIKS